MEHDDSVTQSLVSPLLDGPTTRPHDGHDDTMDTMFLAVIIVTIVSS
jgi:hypothetical protein